MYEIGQYIMLTQNYELASHFLKNKTSQDIFLRSSKEWRESFLALFDSSKLDDGKHTDEIKAQMRQKPYSSSYKSTSHLEQSLFQIIKDDDVERFQQMTRDSDLTALSAIKFTDRQKNEENTFKDDEFKVNLLTGLNPIQFAISCQSIKIL